MCKSNIKSSIIIACIIAICNSECNDRASRADDYTQIVYQPEYAEGFVINGAEGKESVIITSINPWQGASDISTGLFVARNGENPPEGFTGQILKGDARRIVTMSSTHVAMLDAFGATDRIKGVSGLDFISNEYIRMHHDEIADVGYDGNNNYELLMSLEPDLVLLYSLTSASPMETKLKELGIPYMYVGDYLENSPLGKAEWMIALGETCGLRDKAVERFSQTPENYNRLKRLVSDAGIKSPAVMINAPYNGAWFLPPANSYAIQLITDAGGIPAYEMPDTTNQTKRMAAFPIDTENAYAVMSDADIWLNPGIAASLADVSAMCPKFTDTPPMTQGRVYNNNLRTSPTGGNDYFESGVIHPDLILQDLIMIFHPQLIDADFTYYRHLK